MWKLAGVICLIYIFFLLHFTIQEWLLPQGVPPDDSFHFPASLLLCVNVFNAFSAWCVVKAMKIAKPPSALPYLLISIPQQIGLAASNYAVKYVDYPTLSLLKSAKPISVMLCSIFVFRTKISRERIIVVAILTAGLAVFGYKGKFSRSSVSGLLLALVSLVSDAVYVPMVDKLKTNEGGPFMTMFYCYSWSVLFIAVTRIKEVIESVQFLLVHKDMIGKLVAFGLTGSLAHLSLFTAIGMVDGLVISIVTTTRKFFTILLSSLIFSHKLSSLQWTGVMIVFAALGLEIYFKHRQEQEKRRLLL